MAEVVADGVSGLLIDGEWRSGERTIPVQDKVTGETIGTVEVAGPEQIEGALQSAALATDRPFTVVDRARVLRAAARLIAERSAEVVDNYAAETGFAPADGETELARVVQIFELSAQEAERLSGEVVPIHSLPGHENSLCFTQKVPVGVVAAVAPFNAPLSTVAHKIAPAIAAGNAVVLKPAELTPLSSVVMGQALVEAGLPDGRLQLLCGPGRTVGEQIVSHPVVRYVTFTGSTEVGRHIRAVCGMARTHLELGSNSPTIVWSDADLDRALPLVIRAGYRKAGQVCTSVQRLIVHADVAGEVTERLAALVGGLVVGDPRQPGVQVGPVISAASGARVAALLDDAVSTGARVAAGGKVDGSVVTPTLLTQLPGAARLSREEAFAPLVAMSTVTSFGEAVARANETPYGLQAGVFCQDLDIAFQFCGELRMGGVIVNDTSSYHPDSMPYGGLKESGHGLEGPRYAVADMSDTRTVVIRLAR